MKDDSDQFFGPRIKIHAPTVYGTFPTLFGVPLADSEHELEDADVAFLGIPWSAPTTPDAFMVGGARSNYEGTQLTPAYFRLNSLEYGGYFPELDLDVFEHLKIVDCGDVDVVQNMRKTLGTVETKIYSILNASCVPIVIGGNAGPTTYPFLKAVAAHADGPVAILNLDAHGDNQPGEWEEDDPRFPRWASTWALRVLNLPNVDPRIYYHFGLRGPKNDSGTLNRFLSCGVERQHIYTYREIKEARQSGFEQWTEELAGKITNNVSKVWIAIDPDVLNLGSSPDFYATEPMGPTVDEVIGLMYEVGRAAGKQRFGGISIMATPNEAKALHHALMYMILYALAGITASID